MRIGWVLLILCELFGDTVGFATFARSPRSPCQPRVQPYGSNFVTYRDSQFPIAPRVTRPQALGVSLSTSSDGKTVPIYLDHGRATPVTGPVLDILEDSFRDLWGDPSLKSGYGGQRSAEALKLAMTQVAHAVGGSPADIFFTSGAVESNNWAMKGAVTIARAKLQEHFTNNIGGGATAFSSMYVDQLRPHVVTTTAEADSITETLNWLQEMELCDVTTVATDETGVVSVESIVEAMRSTTVLVSVACANAYTGAVQPLADISKAVREWVDEYGERGKQGMDSGVLVHTDASCAIGKIPVDVDALGVDLVTLAGPPVGAPRGVGALYIRGGDAEGTLHDVMQGRSRGDNAGVPVALAAALGKGCAGLGGGDGAAEQEREAGLARSLLVQLEAKTTGVVRGLGPELPAAPASKDAWPRLPNTLCVTFRGLCGEALQQKLGDRVSFTALKGSKAVSKMGLQEDELTGAVRFTVGEATSEQEITDAADAIALAANEMWASAA